MAGVRLREKMVFLGEIMAANKGVVIQITGSDSMAITVWPVKLCTVSWVSVHPCWIT